MNWNSLEPVSTPGKLHAQLKKLLTQEAYGKEWTVTELIATTNPRKHLALDVLDGIKRGKVDKRFPPPAITVRLKVTTRQACHCTKEAAKQLDAYGQPRPNIFERRSAFEMFGEEGDVLPKYDEKPVDGDLVRWKGQAYEVDPDTGEAMDSNTSKAWGRMGWQPNGRSLTEDEFYPVKKEHIKVPVLTALRMLSKNGVSISKAQFRKIDRADKEKRRITNWLFKEAPPRAKKEG
jgi:hypothetical protein